MSPAPRIACGYLQKCGALSLICQKVVATLSQINYLILHTRTDMEYRPQETGPPEISVLERMVSSLPSG